MFEVPECTILARQMSETLTGKIIKQGQMGNTPHKFVWYNRTHAEFEQLTHEKTVGDACARGRWLFVPLEPGYVLLLGECGGKVLYHAPGSALPKSYHVLIAFEDGSHLSATTQMWGAMELYEQGQEQNRDYVKDVRPTPVDPAFTFDYFCHLTDSHLQPKAWSVKALLTQDQMIPGLGNSIAQDILFEARLHPKHAVAELTHEQRQDLFEAITGTVHEVIRQGGRYDEVDLYGKHGGYVRLMDKAALDRPCPVCGSQIDKIQYLGGSCYVCPNCQH